MLAPYSAHHWPLCTSPLPSPLAMDSEPGAPLANTPISASGKQNTHDSWNNAAAARSTSRAFSVEGGRHFTNGVSGLPDDEDRSASDTAGSAIGAGNVAEQRSIAALLQHAAECGLQRLDAELLLARATGLSRATLRAHDELPVAASAQAQFAAECSRRLSGEPLAYIEGSKEFWSLPLQVSPAVLVPRPETELLVERCLALLAAGPQHIADLGTGSGAIALALAHERPQWSITAVDASAAALSVAQANAVQLKLQQVDFRLGSWCEPLGDRLMDAIVSNPPYVAPDDPALALLAHEPLAALAAAEDGYADLLTIASQARDHLRPGGWLLLEHGSTQALRLATELGVLGYAEIVCHADLAGLPRVTQACWPACTLNVGDS